MRLPPEGENSLLVTNADASMLCNSIIGPYLSGNDFRYIGDDVFNVYSDGRNVLDAADDGSWITASNSGRFRKGDLLSVINTADGTCRDAEIVKIETLPKGIRKLYLSPALPQIVSRAGHCRWRLGCCAACCCRSHCRAAHSSAASVNMRVFIWFFPLGYHHF